MDLINSTFAAVGQYLHRTYNQSVVHHPEEVFRAICKGKGLFLGKTQRTKNTGCGRTKKPEKEWPVSGPVPLCFQFVTAKVKKFPYS